MAHIIKKNLDVIVKVVTIAAQIVLGIVFFPIAVVSAIILPKLSSKALRWDIIPIKADYVLVFLVLPMKHWKRWMIEEIGVENNASNWQRKYYFAVRTKRAADRLSGGGVRAVLKDDRLDARDVDNILARRDADELISSLPDLRQAKIYKISGDERLIGMMSDEAQHIAAELTGDYVEFVKAGMRLDGNEWYDLSERNKADLDSCLLMQTPPDSFVKLLLKRSTLELEAAVCVRKYGLSPKLIQSLSDEELAKVKEPLKEFSQRTFLQRTHSSQELDKFFIQEREICVAAQKVMNVDQYKLFHKALYELDPEAVECFLAKEDLRMAELIFKYEEKLSDKAKAIIEASAALKDLSMR